MLNNGILEVIHLNNDFYQKHSESFDKSREFYWEGFNNALNYIKNGDSILDLGCGNARFYKFLKEKNLKINYTGVDSSSKFIDDNHKKYPMSYFLHLDIMQSLEDLYGKKFNFIAIFGVTHHLPSKEFRKMWFSQLKPLVADNGIIMLSFWNFDKSKDDQNFKTNDYKKEEGDYFLGWKGDYSYHRYCHDFSPEEINEIKNIFSNFEILEEFQKEDNNYLILKKNN